MTSDARNEALRELERLHEEVDREAARLAAAHGERLHCGRGCHDCCVDGLTVFDIEAELIRLRHAALLRDGRPHGAGGCAFLDAEGVCRIYPQRPYVCRTQGLPLRWLDDAEGGEIVELRDICPLNADGPPVERLPPEQCWTIGPAEGRLAELQRRFGAGRMTRLPLRALFRRDEGAIG